MKPLFDSEEFSFVGSDEHRIYVYCRKCGHAAEVELRIFSLADEPELIASCPQCENRRRFTFVNVVANDGRQIEANRSNSYRALQTMLK